MKGPIPPGWSILIVLAVSVLLADYVWLQIKFTEHFIDEIILITPPLPKKRDAACVEKAPADGRGVEHYYTGEIARGMPVTVALSCDQKRLTITGSIIQTIRSSDYVAELRGNVPLADIAGDRSVVHVRDDYNFDGFNDLSSVISNGQGIEGLRRSLIFLYDSSRQIFVLDKYLSSMANISPADNDEILQQLCRVSGVGGGIQELKTTCINVYYHWINGRLERIRDIQVEI